MRNNFEGFSISQQGHDLWSLHRQGEIDQARHKKKVEEAIKGHLADIVSQEAIITSDGGKIIKVPIKSLDLPRFRFDLGKKESVGQGAGNSKPGDVLGQAGSQDGSGKGKQAGDQPGIDYYEAEITVEELGRLIFEDLGLPNLKDKEPGASKTTAERFDTRTKKGPMSLLDRKRSVLEAIKREAMQGRTPSLKKIKPEDLRFRASTPTEIPKTSAVVIAMRDVSASMGEFEKYLSRSFYFWMVRFLKTKYSEVQIVFITHHTEAKEVDEETFFKLGESGGTKASSAYKLALDSINKRFSSSLWNIYPVHFSDGDNWGDADNQKCIDLVRQMIPLVNQFGYGEIRKGQKGGLLTAQSAGFLNGTTLGRSLLPALGKEPNFKAFCLGQKEDVLPALQAFFPKENLEGRERRV